MCIIHISRLENNSLEVSNKGFRALQAFKRWDGKKRKESHRIHGTSIFIHIWLIFMVNVGKYAIPGSYGNGTSKFFPVVQGQKFIYHMWRLETITTSRSSKKWLFLSVVFRVIYVFVYIFICRERERESGIPLLEPAAASRSMKKTSRSIPMQ